VGRTKSVPAAPFIETVIPEGLGVLTTWTPAAASEAVIAYRLKAVVATGYKTKTKLPASCAHPKAVSVPASDTSDLVSRLCPLVPYSVTVVAVSKDGTSHESAPSNPSRRSPPSYHRRPSSRR
jgi:hypothetical protein